MINNMSVGKDYTFAYYDADSQQLVDMGDIQSVGIKANYHEVKSEPYNDVPRHGFIPDGYSVDFTITRTGSDLEDFQLAANARFNAGLSSRAGYLNETVRNNDGTVSRYQYTGFVFALEDIGDVSRNKEVSMRAKGYASDKIRVS